MLKFTAELSDQFRRASSLSSLEAYRRTKSASNAVKTHSNMSSFEKPAMEQLKKVTIAQPNRNRLMYSKNQPDHYKSHQLNPKCKMYNTAQSFCSKRINSDIANYMTCPSRQTQPKTVSNFYQNYATPTKIAMNHEAKLANTCSTTNSNKIQQNSDLARDNMVIRILQPKNSLNTLNHNHIQIQQNVFKKKKQNKQTFDENASPTFRSFSNIKQNVSNPTKMRISSINTLQNIQKRIQATLGNHRTLKI